MKEQRFRRLFFSWMMSFCNGVPVLLLVLGILGSSIFDYVRCEPQGVEGFNSDEKEAVLFLQQNEIDSSTACNRIMEASWIYHTNVTDFNRRQMIAVQVQGAELRRQSWRLASRFRWKSFADRSVRRMFSLLSVLGSAALNTEERIEFADLLQDMKRSYSDAKVCPYNPSVDSLEPFSTRPRTAFIRSDADIRDFGLQYDYYDSDTDVLEDDLYDFDEYGYGLNDNDAQRCIRTLRLEPDLVRIMAESRNPNELRHIWRAWREASGRPIRRKYLQFMRLSNKAAKLNGFNDTSEMWKYVYEATSLEDDLERIWLEVKPLYEQLHTYVRRKLITRYDEDIFSSDGTIPAHLLGNMWAQNWLHLADITVPYPERPNMDVTQNMKRLGYTPLTIFRTAEEFFISLGFNPLPLSFWANSMLEKPRDREVICHASAWDFCNGQDYRIKQCTQVSMKDLITAHHEMGHIYYSIAYKDLPLVFRDGANPGFHEAIGDAIALSVTTPVHLAKIGLLPAETTSYEDEINYLFITALDKVAFLPFGMLVDKWRWDVFSRKVQPRDMNDYWWQLKVIYQGVSPPVYRSPFEFDPGAKYHIPANIPYVRYFIGYILQFQIFEELCRVSGHTGDLHKCDFYRSPEAGKKLARLMELGKSQSWRIALSDLTDGRTSQLDARPLLRYFRHLNEWLIRQNRHEDVGWYTNQALFALTGALVNTSSATFIGLLVAALALLIICGLIAMFCFRKAKGTGQNVDIVPS